MSLWTEEHRMLRDTVRRFIDSEINPHVDEWEEAGTVSYTHLTLPTSG